MENTIPSKPMRNSNIEFLKIIAMFLICASHTYLNLSFDGVYAAEPSLNPINWLIVMVKNGGWLGDMIFIACTAYFMNSSKSVSVRKVLYYYFEAYLIFVLYLLVFSLIGFELDGELIIDTLTGVIINNYWYVKAYLVFILFVPVLQILINKLSKKAHFIINICFIVFCLVLTILYPFNLVYGSFYRHCAFTIMFSIFDYGIKYGDFLFFKENDKKRNTFFVILFIVVWFLINAVFNVLNYYYPHISEDTTFFCYFLNPIFIFITIPLFLLVKDMKPKFNKIINYVSSLSFIFYLMHENVFVCMFFDDYVVKAIEAFPTVDMRLPFILLFSIVRFIYGIVLSIIFKETVGRLLTFIFNLITKPKSNKDDKNDNSLIKES